MLHWSLDALTMLTGSNTRTFDMNSWEGLTELLVAGRQASLEQETYQELRDLVLRYAQSGGDRKIKEKIDKIVSAFDFTHSEDEPSKKDSSVQRAEEKIKVMGASRPKPSFKAPKVKLESSERVSQTFVASEGLPSEVDTHNKIEVKKPDAAEPVQVAETEHQTPVNYRQEIAKIKRDVQKFIGNPVSLVGDGNVASSAYMQALLKATRLLAGGGTPGALAEAVKDLEAKATTLMSAAPTVQSDSPAHDEKVVKNQVQESGETETDRKTIETEQVIAEKQDFTPPTEGLEYDSNIDTETKALPAKTSALPDASHSFESLYDNKPEEAILSRLSQLEAPETTIGLERLLNRWSLFRRGGIFNTGPGGVDHPLYKKIAQLTMSDVLAGKFADSNSSIVEAIREHVHSWRDRHNVSYNTDETFEHYLRRVVVRVQERQD